MSATFALSMTVLVVASMYACWKIGFRLGQEDIIERYHDYYRRRRAEEEGDEE